MKNIFLVLIFSILLQSCDDGDIIVTSFDFSEAELKFCGGPGDYVFYRINKKSQESISLKLSTSDKIFELVEDKTYILNGTTEYVNYRSYDGPIGNDYFCRSVPPTSPKVNVDYFAGSGKVDMAISYIYENEIAKKKKFKFTLKDVVLVSGDEKITHETLEMGSIEIVLE